MVEPSCAGVGARRWRDLPHHDAIRLRIGSDHEDVRAHVDEAALAIVGLGALVALPDAKPQGARTEPGGVRLDALHQPLREAAAVPRVSDVEPPDFDGGVPVRTGGRRPAAQLRVAGQVAFGLDKQRRDVRVRELASLLQRPVRLGDVERDVFGAIVRGERLAECPRRQLRERRGVRRGSGSNGDVHSGMMAVAGEGGQPSSRDPEHLRADHPPHIPSEQQPEAPHAAARRVGAGWHCR